MGGGGGGPGDTTRIWHDPVLKLRCVTTSLRPRPKHLADPAGENGPISARTSRGTLSASKGKVKEKDPGVIHISLSVHENADFKLVGWLKCSVALRPQKP